LKLGTLARLKCGTATFRDRKIAASLKPVPNITFAFSSTAFRDRKIAASLKHRLFSKDKAFVLPFPRSKDRGLIEAAEATRSAGSAANFPRSKDRGLIEARPESSLTIIATTFPRSKDRGLIEAIFTHGFPF